MRHPDLPWDFRGLSTNPNTTVRLVDTFGDAPWDYCLLGSLPSLRLEDVARRPGKPWRVGLTRHIGTEQVLADPNPAPYSWDWHAISRSTFLDITCVSRAPHLPWEWDEINSNGVVTADDVREHPHLPWDEYQLMCNPKCYDAVADRFL